VEAHAEGVAVVEEGRGRIGEEREWIVVSASTRQQQKVRQLMNTMLLAWWRPVNIRIF